MTLEQVFECPATLASLRGAPLGMLLEGFCKSLLERGFSRSSVRKHLSSVSHLNEHLRGPRPHMRRTVKAKKIEEFFEEYAARCRHRGPLEEHLRRMQWSLHRFADYLRHEGHLVAASARPIYQPVLDAYSMGIRIGEAFALNLEDFHPEEPSLYVAKGKFRKARWVPLSVSASEALRQYLERRREMRPCEPDSPLLLNQRGRRLCHPSVYQVFRRLLDQCAIAYHRDTGPRIHDMRHTFAVHRLLAWYRDGEDVNARLPWLATYLGHVDIQSTQVYLRATAELLEQVDHRFHRHYLEHVQPRKGTV